MMSLWAHNDFRSARDNVEALEFQLANTTDPVEMDVLRALGRKEDVAKAWKELKALRTAPAVHKEGLVVYAAHLIDGEVVVHRWEFRRCAEST